MKYCRFGACSVYTVQPYTSIHYHFIQSHIGRVRVYVCLAATCHLHFWQNHGDLLRATAVTRGWNGYRNMSQHRKLTLEKKLLPPLLPGLEPGTFRSRVRRSNYWAIPAPHHVFAANTENDDPNCSCLRSLPSARRCFYKLCISEVCLLHDWQLGRLISLVISSLNCLRQFYPFGLKFFCQDVYKVA